MRQKVKEWLWRYGPAELVSIPATILPAWLVFQSTGSKVGAALAGTWGGNVGYFGTVLLRDVWQTKKALAKEGRTYTLQTLGKNMRALVVEFGVAELLDTLLIRPMLMYWFPIFFHSLTWGILLAKVVADISFYLPAIIFYELSKSRFRKF